MINKKYEFVDGDTIEHNGKTLRRIRAIASIGLLVSSGDLGGYIESESNLTLVGNAWVYGNAQVHGDARVYGDARVESDKSIFWATKVGNDNATLTAFKNKDGQITLVRGCFIGSIDEFKAASAKKHDARTMREYELLIDVARSRILDEEFEVKNDTKI